MGITRWRSLHSLSMTRSVSLEHLDVIFVT
jgi:hypothetical protein